jgi:hypothetical protein
MLCGIIKSGEVDEALKAWGITHVKHGLMATRGE